jgi:myo-inositol-1(or 4)-monophosphatase
MAADLGIDLRLETRTAIEAVRNALKLAEQDVRLSAASSKGERDIVTAIDLAVEDSIRAELVSAFGWPVIGEERDGDPRAVDGTRCWLLDPICGTRNLASGIPLYSVNLALVEGGMFSLSVVGNPSTHQICFAEFGKGAWELSSGKPRKLGSSEASETIVIEEVKANDSRRDLASRFIAAAIRADRWDFRSFGSTIGLAYVASGGVSAYCAPRASALHCAAGALLAAEAGATVTDLEGRPWTMNSDSILASANRNVHGELLRLVPMPVAP